MLVQFAPLIAIVLFMFYMSSNAKRKQERERLALLSNLKRGDRIRMHGGEFGAVVEVKDNRIQIKVDESSNTKIWYAKDAVQGVVKEASTEESK